MAINFTDSPADGATQVIGGRTYTYNSTKNKWDTTATEVTGPTATVYATVDALPTSGNTTGAQAYVSGNNRLYIWNGTGWYNIALINTAPSISGVSSSYALASDGTATTVTITASDPEGLPITYSIASDTSGNIATVSQSSNVFTITPTTNTANAGTFSLTFRASDGVNLATAVAEFTLAFSVPNSKYTSLLLTTNGSTGGNTTFVDSSSNSHTITPNGGNTVQSTFSPYRHGGYSTYFDGSGDYLSISGNNIMNFGSSDWTVEGWVYLNAMPTSDSWPSAWSSHAILCAVGTPSLGDGFNCIIGQTQIFVQSNDTKYGSATHDMSVNTWHHLAYVRSGDTIYFYVDGVQKGTTAFTGSVGTGSTTYIGTETGQGAYLNGNIADLRVVKGTAVYTAAFTPPEERLTAVTNTSLLTCHLPYIADGSTNNYTITPNGNVATIPFSPYDYQSEYAVGDNGGSVYLFGTTGNNLDITPSAANLGTGDFTIECWTYWDADPRSIIYDTRQSDGNSGHAIFMTSTTHNVVFYDNNATVLTSAGAVRQGIWNHIAVVRNSGTINIFINGKKDTAQVTGNTTNFDAHTFRIGEKTYGGIPNVKGNITDFRISSTARYTTDFTPATAPLASDGDTSLLLNMQGATILDKAQANARVILVGNTTASTTQYKYLPSSIYFDGADDGIRIPMASGVGATARLPGSFVANEDFTIEMWHYLTARTELYPCLFSNYTTSGASTLGLFAGHNSSTTTQYQVAVNGTFPAINAGTINYNQWVHVALVRSSGTITLYIDGTSVGTHSSSAALPGNGNWMGIGLSQDTPNDTNIQGYLSDVRITRGLARYTANFTPPSAALDG